MNIGDYVRTPRGVITKIIDIQEETGQYFMNGNAVSLESKNYISDKNITIGENFKHSSNIIDLIEENDIVNHQFVNFVCEEGVNVGRTDYIKNEDIKSVITHEQIENGVYKL